MVFTRREQTTHFGTRVIYRSYVDIEWDTGSIESVVFPLDVPSGPEEADSSNLGHEHVVLRILQGEL